MAKPINRWLRKDVKPSWLDPHDKQLQAFNTLKHELVKPPVLAVPVTNRPILLEMDCSDCQIGVTLVQLQDDDIPTKYETIGYCSLSLTDVERQ